MTRIAPPFYRRSPFYWHPFIYTYGVRLMYGRGFTKRYRAVAAATGGLNVFDVCCGDSHLANFLDPGRYSGMDFNSIFVAQARRQGLNVTLGNVLTEPWPAAECVVIMASLYQFMPDHQQLIEKALRTATKRVVLSEPIRNLADSPSPVIAWLARHLSNPGLSAPSGRFNRQSLLALYQAYGVTELIDAGRELVGIFEIDCGKSSRLDAA